jgi:integrase/recombinase XerD
MSTDLPLTNHPSNNLPTPKLLMAQFLQWMRMRGCSERTVHLWTGNIERFIGWSAERGIDCVSQVTPETLAAYRRSLFHYRNRKTDKPLKFATQVSYLTSVRRWFVWLAREKFIPSDPARDLELPKEEQRLPAGFLSATQVETVLNQTDVTTAVGLRDRAILETFYSTGLRCSELVSLGVYDIDAERRTVIVRQGKGRKDRVVPIGPRAVAWVEKHSADVRPRWVWRTNELRLFLSSRGQALHRNHLSALVKGYLVRAGVRLRGSCHLLRHSAATLMMENGADMRSLQEMLGHAMLNTTQIYTHVSIQHLRQVHERTHPAGGLLKRDHPTPKPDDSASAPDGISD